jgi:hypothetical protein
VYDFHRQTVPIELSDEPTAPVIGQQGGTSFLEENPADRSERTRCWSGIACPLGQAIFAEG